MDKASSYSVVEQQFQDGFDALGVRNDIRAAAGDNTAEKLNVISVGINGNPRGGSFVERIENSIEKHQERLDIAVKIQNLRELNEDDVRAVALQVLKSQLEKIKSADGTTLADAYDFSGKGSNDDKSYEDKLAEVKALIEKAQTETPGIVPPEVQALLLNSSVFNPVSHGGDFYVSRAGTVRADKGHVEIDFSIPEKTEGDGELNNATLVKNNILARKDAILDSIREAVKTNHVGSVSDEELANLDLQIDSGMSEGWGRGITVRVGSKAIAPADPNQVNANEQPVGPTALAGLSAEYLHRIVSDSILLKGPGAEEVAPMITSENDVKHFLKLYAPQVPAFAEALKNDAMSNYADRQKEAADKKITPRITIDTSISHDADLSSRDTVHILTELPKGVNHSQVIAALSGKPVVVPQPVGPATDKLIAAANENDKGQQAAIG